jgi:hypothetical protein
MPPLFAVAEHENAWVYSTLWDPTTGTWHVAPHRIYPADAFTPAFIMDSDARGRTERATLTIHSPTPRPLASARTAIHHETVEWRYDAWRIYSMFDPHPIPVITVHEAYDPSISVRLTRYAANMLNLHPGTEETLAFWRRRWNPDGILDDLDTFLHPPAPIIKTKTVTVTAPAPPPPAFVTALVVADAVAKADTCPITLSPITVANAAVTSCFHVFDGEAIATWLSEHKTCPVCKQATAVVPK